MALPMWEARLSAWSTRYANRLVGGRRPRGRAPLLRTAGKAWAILAVAFAVFWASANPEARTRLVGALAPLAANVAALELPASR
jgi:hypothetical protein